MIKKILFSFISWMNKKIDIYKFMAKFYHDIYTNILKSTILMFSDENIA